MKKGSTPPATPPSSSSSATKAKTELPLPEITEPSPPIKLVAAAAVSAIATVCIVSKVLEQVTSNSVPPFDPNGERYDQSTFAGRFCRMILACDPLLLLHSEEETRRCRALVDDRARIIAEARGVAIEVGIKDDATTTTLTDLERSVHRTLWEAHRISCSSIHPDTLESIPHPFRMSGYVPFNGPICVSMVASSSTPAILFWSFMNQSHNALVNYSNRNASSSCTMETLVQSYVVAVGSALAVAFGLATFIKKRYDPTRARQLMRFVAFPSAVVASSLNCYIVRSPEIKDGVSLHDENGNNVLPEGERSKIAAAAGVQSTTLSRAVLQAPVYFLPPFLMANLPPLKMLLAKSPHLSVPIATYLVLVSFGLGLPATVAIFPQNAEVAAGEVEERFQSLKDGNGKIYEKFYYNKGL